MEKTRDIVGKFVLKFIIFGIIFGTAAFLLENLIPQWLDIKLGVALLAIHTGVFFIAMLLITKFTMMTNFRKTELTENEGKTIIKSIRVLLIFVAIIVMFFNFFYCANLYLSTEKDIDRDVDSVYTDMSKSEKEKAQKEDKEKYFQASAILLASKEIITMGSFIFVTAYMKSKVYKCIKE